MLEWGKPEIIALFKRREERGERSPSWDNRPRLWADSLLPMHMFQVLHGNRAVNGFGACPLQIADITALLGMYDFDSETRIELFQLVLALDAEWLDWARSKSTSHGNTSTGNPDDQGSPGRK